MKLEILVIGLFLIILFSGCTQSNQQTQQQCDGLDKSSAKYLECIKKSAVANPSLCSTIEDSAYKNTCFIDVAYEKNDQSVCENIDSQSYKDTCQIKFVQSKSECETKYSGSIMKNNCLSYLATNLKDESICKEISTATQKYSCLGNVAFAKNDLSVCDSADLMAKEYCLTQVAVLKKDIQVCQSFEYLKQACENSVKNSLS